MENYVEIKAQLTRIETAIMGDDKMGTKGLVHQQQEHSKKISELSDYKEKDEKYKAKVTGGLAIGIPVIGGVWALFVEWIKNKF